MTDSARLERAKANGGASRASGWRAASEAPSPVAAESRQARQLGLGFLVRLRRASAALHEHAALRTERGVCRVTELGERGSEQSAALEWRRLRAHEHQVATGQAAQSTEARVRAAELAAVDLEADAFGDSREILQHAVDIHAFKTIPFLPAGPLSPL